ncbi:hypothetical protein N7537_008858 [Penicillium hordei]|uniref:Uncharacterized protein n=1 Tax=Penicillium hordei TaxID=40994 RepID=A0AAD6H182_9EURO|nr:uncharacterized protein N7537_008858 [Penicillium hordei]KAJ5598774.1 hypothetical protein N7537_008858 [Penicillium hordei]
MDTSPRTSVEKLIQHPKSPSLDESEGSDWAKESQREGPRTRRRVLVISLIVISFLINIALAIVVYNAPQGQKSDAGQGRAPADTAISKKLVKFQNGISSDTTLYQGMPTTENNRLWKELYARELVWYSTNLVSFILTLCLIKDEMTRISYEEALQLPNKTSPEAPYEGSGYLIVLNVFHNLHCLDSIRKALYYFADPKWTAEDNPYIHMGDGGIDSMLQAIGKNMGITHVDHCIDALRQHQMCSVDITPNVFQYSPKDFGIRAMANVVHECRDFEKVEYPLKLKIGRGTAGHRLSRDLAMAKP